MTDIPDTDTREGHLIDALTKLREESPEEFWRVMDKMVPAGEYGDLTASLTTPRRSLRYSDNLERRKAAYAIQRLVMERDQALGSRDAGWQAECALHTTADEFLRRAEAAEREKARLEERLAASKSELDEAIKEEGRAEAAERENARLRKAADAANRVLRHWNGGERPKRGEFEGTDYLSPSAAMVDATWIERLYQALAALDQKESDDAS